MPRVWIGYAGAIFLAGLLLSGLCAASVGEAPAPGQETPPPQTRPQAKPQDEPSGEGEASKPSALDPALLRTLKKSLFVPGWGQAAEKRYLEAGLFFAVEAGCLAAILVNNHSGNENYALYKAAATAEDAVRFRALTERYDARRNRFILAAAAVWALNLADTYLIVRRKNGRAQTLRLGVETGDNATLALRLGYRY